MNAREKLQTRRFAFAVIPCHSIGRKWCVIAESCVSECSACDMRQTHWIYAWVVERLRYSSRYDTESTRSSKFAYFTISLAAAVRLNLPLLWITQFSFFFCLSSHSQSVSMSEIIIYQFDFGLLLQFFIHFCHRVERRRSACECVHSFMRSTKQPSHQSANVIVFIATHIACARVVPETMDRMRLAACLLGNAKWKTDLLAFKRTWNRINPINAYAGVRRRRRRRRRRWRPIQMNSHTARTHNVRVNFAFQLVYVFVFVRLPTSSALHSSWPLHWHTSLEQNTIFPWLNALSVEHWKTRKKKHLKELKDLRLHPIGKINFPIRLLPSWARSRHLNWMQRRN